MMKKDWLKEAQPLVQFFVWVFGMILATFAVVQILELLDTAGQWFMIILLILFWISTLLIWLYYIREWYKRTR